MIIVGERTGRNLGFKLVRVVRYVNKDMELSTYIQADILGIPGYPQDPIIASTSSCCLTGRFDPRGIVMDLKVIEKTPCGVVH